MTDSLLDLDARALAAALRHGPSTVADHLVAVLDRIAALDPQHLAFSQLNPGASRDAEALDRRPPAEREELPLFGVPVAIKEELDVAGLVTTLGTSANTGPAAVDSEVVARLRAAGAVVVGKTHMPEFGQAPFTDGAWGATRNPVAPGRSPGGSSGGSAVAVATRMVPVAIGGDAGGSVRIPSAWCGIVGLKPTRGAVSTAPHPNLWYDLGTYGPMGRTVDDVELLLGIIADPTASPRPVDEDRLRVGWTLGCSLPWITPEPEVAAAVENAASTLASDGHAVERGTVRWRPQPLAYLVQFHRGVLDEVDRLDDPGRIERRSRQTAAVGRSIPDSVLRWALRDSSRMAADMARLFTRLDVLLTPVTPTLPPPTPRLWDRGAPASMGASTPAISFTNHWNLAGNPAVSVPMGRSEEGLPLAVQVIGAHGADRLVLRVARRLAEA